MSYSSGNPIVDAVGAINFQGDIIPHAWFKNILLKTGKPDLQAIVILGRIVYWYRPTTVFNESTGAVIGTKRKFKADLLQQSYEALANYFGLSKNQVKDATDRLVALGVIQKHFRTIEVYNSTPLNNVLFISINTNVLASISDLANAQNNTPLLSILGGGSPEDSGEAPVNFGGTNTKTTTETTPYINTHTHAVGDENEWSPNLENLKAVLSTTRFSHLVDSIVDMPDFKFHLGNFNAHWENKTSLTENQKTRKFAQWITLEFEKSQKQATTRNHGAKKPHQYGEQPTKRFGNYQEEQQFKDVN